MNLLRIVCGLGVLWLAGCAMVTDATHLVSYELRKADEERQEARRNACWADEALAQVMQTSAPLPEDYVLGFKAGFVHHVDTGWTEPPPLAPKQYRTLQYQCPEGHVAIRNWFAGYRYGVQVAREGGYRNWVTGPSSLPPPAHRHIPAPPLAPPAAVESHPAYPQAPLPYHPPPLPPAADDLLPQPRREPNPEKLPGTDEPPLAKRANAPPAYLRIGTAHQPVPVPEPAVPQAEESLAGYLHLGRSENPRTPFTVQAVYLRGSDVSKTANSPRREP